MDKMTAALLLENLLDRVELDAATGKWRLGTLSSKERIALELAVGVLGGNKESMQASFPSKFPEPIEQPVSASLQDGDTQQAGESSTDSVLVLNIRAIEQSTADNPEVTFCLDFGTAMSKAFAMRDDADPIELALGSRAGGNGYTVDSSLFITDDGLILFGPKAVAKSTSAVEAGRARFDSPKARLSMGDQGEIDRISVRKEINPTDICMSEGELITLYLGYLTDLAVSELESHGYSRYTQRRFARPCWPEERNRWAEPLLTVKEAGAWA